MKPRPWLLPLVVMLAGASGGGLVLAAQALRPQPAAGDVRAYLLAHPDVIPEAMQVLRDRETGKAVAANRKAIMEPFPGAVGGNPNGDVTVVAYMDYACTYCRANIADVARLVSADKGVRVVYRELPILSPQSRTAAAWSLAAAEQGKFMRYHEAVYAGGALTEDSIRSAAAAAGLDSARAARLIASPQVAAEISRNMQVAGALGMTGTPSWVIGDRVTSGLLDYNGLVAAVKAARAKG